MIEVTELTKVYGATRAIHDLSFTVERGEILGFLGPNGAGKSTTMRILAGALSATSGAAKIGGIDVLHAPQKVKAMVGYLPERPPLYTEMSVRKYLAFCARIKGGDPAHVGRVIERVGLGPVADRLIEHLSKGYRQRVGIAQALVHQPKVLILDEPASGLDPAQRVEIRELVKELAAGDTTVILSTHVLPEVEAICDRVVIIDRGVIQLESAIGRDGVLTAQAEQRVVLRVARPEAALVETLQALEGVASVERFSDEGRKNPAATGSGARFVVIASGDVREDVARVAVPFGLLELRTEGALEDVFIQLTHDGRRSAAQEAS
jgi:ABC-2 type transport system ATP-binding protein